ncbi:cytochrome P450 [Streptomyces somaliensis DSM 40738]|uniref:Cytochrome P450 n=1 Tax=Streptomyces somaliensis (strain ATCC 33201 / DSM 40738 / JCM 12659 / KCTC 9044 / NCTC 11332 / NRRL B-12077 / IP 733) TaxID=1134445 RepID=A0AA44IDL9_STRE0|nr:cytochrome P450 [Streptomyces somaliensis]MCQ0021628.1 cytochrome P450 [Streptomyces somaliensis DSM 40738]NKY14647.1 cytochrome P450 [Streptomyces somaliensis DSM 40738]
MSVDVSSVPRAPGALPVLGHAWQLWRDPLGFLNTLRRTGEIVRVDLGTMPVYMVTTPRLIHEVTVRQGRNFEKGRLFDRVRPLVGNGLATATGEVHRRHRRLLQPMFHPGCLAGYAEVMAERARALADSWTPGQRVAVEGVMMEYTVEALAETMFSAEIARPAVEAVRRDIPVILKNMLVRAASPKFLDRLPVRANRDFDAAAENLRRVIDEVIVNTRGTGRTGRPDLLSVLLDARDADTGEALTDVEVRDELVTMLFAGTETTASTLSWAFHELARHPEVERQVVAEIDEVLGDRPVGFEDVPRLGTVRRVLDEAIRLYGVTLLMRRTLTPVELGGYLVPEGAEVAFSLYAMHRDPAIFERPDDFDPDRWLPERAASIDRQSYIPFGAGSRKCIGDSFSWTQATIVLATVLQRWRLRPAPGHTPKAAAAAMAHPDHVPMIVSARER